MPVTPPARYRLGSATKTIQHTVRYTIKKRPRGCDGIKSRSIVRRRYLAFLAPFVRCFSPCFGFTFRCVEFATNICNVHMRRWQLQAHLTHRVSNDLRYGRIPEPLVIGWNDVPRRTLCAGQSDGVLIRRYVFWP